MIFRPRLQILFIVIALLFTSLLFSPPTTKIPDTPQASVNVLHDIVPATVAINDTAPRFDRGFERTTLTNQFYGNKITLAVFPVHARARVRYKRLERLDVFDYSRSRQLKQIDWDTFPNTKGLGL